MTAQDPTRTISIPVSAAWHTVTGLAIALAAILAFWAHLQLPVGHTYRAIALGIGVAGFGFTLTYWVVCIVQRGRAEAADIAEAVAAVEERQRVILAALLETAEQTTETTGAMKALHDQIAEATGAVEALQDVYAAEGPAHPRGRP